VTSTLTQQGNGFMINESVMLLSNSGCC